LERTYVCVWCPFLGTRWEGREGGGRSIWSRRLPGNTRRGQRLRPVAFQHKLSDDEYNLSCGHRVHTHTHTHTCANTHTHTHTHTVKFQSGKAQKG